VIEGKAPESLLDSYDDERIYGADENILNSSRSTDFITPKSDMSRLLRDAVLDLSEHYEFARPLVNSGRLSVPCTYDKSQLNSADKLDGPARTRPGSPCPDAPMGDDFLLNHLGDQFTLLTINADAPDELDVEGIKIKRLALSSADDKSNAIKERYLGNAQQAVYLIRPDQHVTARHETFDQQYFTDALRRAVGKSA
jgi:3-(3-hydroxy-phenyl)propionate hydroxylase